jgi:hypothetical protein
LPFDVRQCGGHHICDTEARRISAHLAYERGENEILPSSG